MRYMPIIAVLLLIVAGSGCRTTKAPYEAESLTNRYAPFQASASVASDLASETTGSPGAASPTTFPVAFPQESEQRGPGGSPQPLPAPQAASLPQSDLTLADLEDIAMRNNPALAQAAARLDAARGNWIQAGLPPNVVLGYSGQQLGSRGQAEQQGVFIGQEVVTGKKLRLNRQVAAWEIQRLENEFEAYRLRVLTDVRIAFYDVLVAQRRRELAAELVRISEQAVSAAQALFRGEEVSEADPLRARVDADTARIVLQNAINQHVGAWRRLSAVLGVRNLPLRRIEGELNPDDLTVTWQEELQRLLTQSPEMAAAIANVEAARWSVERAYAEVIPNVDVQAVIQDDRGTGSTNGNLQVSVPIPILNRNQGGIQAARAELAAAERAVDRLSLDLQARLASAFQRYENARNQVHEYARENGIIANSRRTLDLVRAGYQAEEFGVLDLLTAQRTYFQTNLAYLDSLRELSASVMEIRGLLLKGSLSE